MTHVFVEAWRGLSRHRTFSIFVVAILAIGAGSATALVGLADALLLRPPAHVVEPDRLVNVNGAANYVLHQEVARQSTTLDVAAVSNRRLPVGQSGATGTVECVTDTYFAVLRVKPFAGRSFLASDVVAGAEPVAMLGFARWQRDFGGRPDAIGATFRVAGRSYRVIGIAPPDFRGLGFERLDAWLPITAVPELCSFSGQDLLSSRTSAWLTTVGRLRSGVPIQDAERDIRSLALHEVRRPGSQRLSRELEPAVSRRAAVRDELLALSLATGAVLMLLIVCANVAGLLSVRALHRHREIALRSHLGASRTRIVGLLLAENLLLAGVSACAAWGVGRWLTSILTVFFPRLARDTWFDWRDLITLAAFTLSAGIVAAAVPAIQTARLHAERSWRVGNNVGVGGARWRSFLSVGQIALALVLVTGTGLFARSLNLAKHDLGYQFGRVLVAQLDTETSGVPLSADMYDSLLARVRAAQHVEAASLTARAPDAAGRKITVMARPRNLAAGSLVQMAHDVSPDYFRTLGTRIVAGRSFTVEDRLGAPSVMIVDEGLARELWPGEAVVGKCRSLYPAGPCLTVVGLSERRRFSSLTRRDGEVFMPLAQRPISTPQVLLVRATGHANDAIPAVAAAIKSVHPSLALVGVKPLSELVDQGARTWRLGATVFGVFGVLAVVVSAIGLYGVLALTVRQRTPEIGIRMALGADHASAAKLIVGQGLRLLAAGLVIGLGGSLAAANWIRGLLFGVHPYDPVTLALASLLVASTVLAAFVVPARRAANVDPVSALRAD